MKPSICIAAAALALAAVSCSKAAWKAEGTIAGAEGKQLILEAPDNMGRWYPLDTVEVDKKGRFSLSEPAAGHPEVFRLTLGKESLYFPIDSIETVNITSDAASFATSATLSGSDAAEKMQQINELINKVVSRQGEQAVAYDPDLKRALAEAILRDPAGIVAYYTIFRRVGDTPIFDITNRSDLRLIGAVANAYNAHRPADPRTPYLASLYLQARRATGSRIPTDTIVAQEITLPEIKLLDRNGKPRTLSAEAQKAKVVLLNFTAYAAENSPALNVELARIYRENHGKGLEIYQVAVDDDEFAWRQAAENLPWITVYNSQKEGAATLMRYNVTALPATFIINNGELVERIDDPTRIASSVARYL